MDKFKLVNVRTTGKIIRIPACELAFGMMRLQKGDYKIVNKQVVLLNGHHKFFALKRLQERD
jgi:hypothetical protein